MELTTNNKDLAAAMGKVCAVAQKNGTLGILSTVRLIASEDKLELTGTNLESSVIVTIDASIENEGSVCIDANKLLTFARNAKADVLFSVHQSTLTLRSGRRKFELATVPSGDFPECRSEDMTPLPVPELMAMISSVSHAMGNNDSRYFLNGVYVEFASGKANIVATDGHRLSARTMEAAGDCSVIVPRKTVLTASSMFSEPTISVGSNMVEFKEGNTCLRSSFVDGRYPDWTRVLPRNNSERLSFDSVAMIEAINSVKSIDDNKFRKVKIDITGGQASISAASIGRETAVDVIDCECTIDTSIAISGDYLSDAIKGAGTEAVEFHINSSSEYVAIAIIEHGLYEVVQPVRL